jgi:lipopolysaccharide/colanic/teichoic acid biosynthesis glycosyltransferase
VKRFLDIVVAITALILTLPLMLIIGMLVRIYLGHPVLYRQERPGRNRIPFQLYKFRTMLESYGQVLADSDGLTRFGRLLRHTSLDECPELLRLCL